MNQEVEGPMSWKDHFYVFIMSMGLTVIVVTFVIVMDQVFGGG